MRITKGNRKRQFVYNVKLGRTQVKRLMLDGNQIWPSGERIRTLAIEPPTDPYWVHALDAVKSGASSSRFIGVTIAGRTYLVNATYNSKPLAQYSLGVLDFGADGPPFGDVKEGDTLTFSVYSPARESLMYEGEAVCKLPYLSNTCLHVQFKKGKKKRWAGRRFTVTGQPGGVVHYGGSCETSEHKRGTKVRILPQNTHKWYNKVYNNSMPTGETELHIDTAGIGSSYGGGGVKFLWPKFSKSIKTKVTAVTLYE